MNFRLLSAAALLATLAALAGCASTKPGGTAADPRAEIRAAALQYAACMRGRAYEVTDPTFDEQGLPRFTGPAEVGKRQDYERDHRECGSALNAALRSAGVRGKETPSPEQLVAFTRCVREQGLPIADPQPGGELQIDKQTMNSPAWPAAVEACRHHMPPEMAPPGKLSTK